MIYALAILWPFAAFVLSFRDFKYRDFSIAVLAVAAMFGLCVQVIATQTMQADITRNLVSATFYQDVPWSFIFTERDYFIGISGKLLCLISDDLRFLAVSYTLIKALLFLRCVKIVVDNMSDSSKRIAVLPLLAMVFVVGFYDVNSLRFTIASVFFLWCSLEILINNNRWFYAFILLCPFIHYGFWIMAPVPLLFILLKNRTRLVWVVFVLSFVYSTTAASIWIDGFVEEYGTEVLSENVGAYASEENLERMAERYEEGAKSGNLNRAISRTAVDVRNYGVMTCVVLFSIYGFRKRKENRNVNQMMNYLLIVYSCANIANSNSQGLRFYLVAAMVVVFMLVFIMYRDDGYYLDFYKKNKPWVNVAFVLVSLSGALYLFIGRDMMNLLGVIFGNFFFHL